MSEYPPNYQLPDGSVVPSKPKRSQRPSKVERMRRIEAALDRIAATMENGELMLATDQPGFFEAVAERMEQTKPGSSPDTDG